MAHMKPFASYMTMYEVETKEGWYSRLSAPGYLDATDWVGPYDTEKEALDAVCEFYEVDGNGDDLPEWEDPRECRADAQKDERDDARDDAKRE